MTEPLWLDRELILLLHDDILAATGGAQAFATRACSIPLSLGH